VTGSFDADVDTIYLTTGHYAMSGRYYRTSVPPAHLGGVTGLHEGSFHCVLGEDTAIEVWAGTGATGEKPRRGDLASSTKDRRALRRDGPANPQWPFLGYHFSGTIPGPGLHFDRSSRRGEAYWIRSRSAAMPMSRPTRQAGSWDSIPLIDEIGDG
jgi:hypothetical protein